MNGGIDVLQLVLNAIFHLEASPGNLEWKDYEFIRKHPAVQVAIPIAVGDNLRGYRIVGTLDKLFSDVEYAPGRRYAVEPGGRIFAEDAKEAVGHGLRAKRSKSGAISFDLVEGEVADAPLQ